MGYRDKPRNENIMPYWRRRIVEKQKVLRKDLGQVNRMRRNELQNEVTKEKIERKYRWSVKGLEVVHEELQQKLVAIEVKLGRLFEANQKKLFSELEGGHRETIEPEAEESTRF